MYLARIRQHGGTLLVLTAWLTVFYGASRFNARWEIACYALSLVVLVLALAFAYTSWLVKVASVLGIALCSYGLIWYLLKTN